MAEVYTLYVTVIKRKDGTVFGGYYGKLEGKEC